MPGEKERENGKVGGSFDGKGETATGENV